MAMWFAILLQSSFFFSEQEKVADNICIPNDKIFSDFFFFGKKTGRESSVNGKVRLLEPSSVSKKNR